MLIFLTTLLGTLSSTPAKSIFGVSVFVMAIAAIIFVIVFSLLAYSVVKFRKRANDDDREPPQVYGSNQVELAWTVIPVLTVLAFVHGDGTSDSRRSEGNPAG
jgi:heme/copper-type cytochrome/quinol oxidase subunit 2